MDKFLLQINKIWDHAADQAEFIAGIFFAIGLFLLGASYFLDIHTVEFDGNLQKAKILSDTSGVPVAFAAKEVGFVLAPNWGITGLIFLPLAVLTALRARAAIKPLLRNLVQKGMLVDREFRPVAEEMVVQKWEQESKRWAAIAMSMFLFSFCLVMFLDFIPVVADWLLSTPEEVAVLASGMTLQHDTFEFDWSVAATFQSPVVDPIPNLVFGFFAYIVIAAFGSGFLLASFIYFISLCAFFSPSKMERNGLLLLPKVDSDDPRLGFESFEKFFDLLVQASIFTAIIAVAMHLQNVYLRSPIYTDIVQMVFGKNVNKIRDAITEPDLTALVQALTSTSDALGIPLKEMTLQSFASSLALFLICAIVFVCVWLWLRISAKDGQDMLRNRDDISAEQKRRLNEMSIWPVGWISLNSLIIVAILVGLSMWYVNFVSVVIIYLIVRMLLGFGWIFWKKLF